MQLRTEQSLRDEPNTEAGAVEAFFEMASPEEVQRRLKEPSLFTHIEVACA
jgi:hypothetical protein